jgi:hypothetical protein
MLCAPWRTLGPFYVRAERAMLGGINEGRCHTAGRAERAGWSALAAAGRHNPEWVALMLPPKPPPPPEACKLRNQLATTQPNRNRLADDVSYSRRRFWRRSAITEGSKSRPYFIVCRNEVWIASRKILTNAALELARPQVRDQQTKLPRSD